MPRISDRKLASLYEELSAKRGSPTDALTHEQVLQLLAVVGDSVKQSSKEVLEALTAKDATRAQQVAVVQAGLTDRERDDLRVLLQAGATPLSADARALLDEIIGKQSGPTDGEPAKPTAAVDGLSILGGQKDGFEGLSKAGAVIEAINISAAPGGRLKLEDTSVIATADADGKFSLAKLYGDQEVREGDLVRVRARYADGTTSDWITVKASGLADADKRNAVVALFRIGLTDKGNGKLDCTNINASRQVSEPGAVLQFTNARTQEKTQVTLNDRGSFPEGFTLPGKAGDVFQVAASDGVNNVDFAESVGHLTVPGGDPGNQDLVADPALHKDELKADGTPRFGKKRFTGPLFVGGPDEADPMQGQIGNCYFPAAIAAIAKANPDAITNLIRDNGDGTYTVTFKQRDWATGKVQDVPIQVDADLWVRSYGGPLYGRSTGPSDTRSMELWYPLVEKAYAQWKGSFDAIGNGGRAEDVFEEVLGKSGRSLWLAEGAAAEDRAWRQIVASVDAKTPVAAGTGGHDDPKYTNSGVYGDHAYSVLGYEEVAGERYVRLRNPWGESEPSGNGANDGIFKLPIKDFTRLFNTLYYVQ